MERHTATTLLLAMLAWLCFSQPALAADTPSATAAQTANSEQVKETVPPPPEASPKAMRYYESGNIIWFVNLLWGFIVPGVLLFSGFSAKLRNLATRWGRYWYFSLVIYFVMLSLLLFVVDFPLDYYVGFIRPHDYGLSDQAFSKWLGDSFKSLGVGMVMGALLLWMPYLLLRKATKRWWLYTAAGSVPVILVFLVIAPIWISPLFNDFGPMKDKGLETKILALANRAHIEGARVFEVNKSVDTKTVNAYVTGMGSSKRIVLWDTIIAKLSPRELLFVMGHEMGHYVLGHVWSSILFSSGILFLTLYLVHRTSGWVLARWGDTFGFHTLGDFASLPLLMIMMGLFSFFVQPVAMAFTRYHEHEADRFALEITHDNAACAGSFVKLSDENLANPRPGWLYKLWRSSHPPVGERYDFCLSYHPWQDGKPGKYAAYFTPPTSTPQAGGD